MKLINVGFGNMVNAQRVLAIVAPDAAPVKRLVADARSKGMLVDATAGRRTRAVLVCDSDHVVLSASAPDTLAARAGAAGEAINTGAEGDEGDE